MNHVKKIDGWPPRDALLKLVQLWPKIPKDAETCEFDRKEPLYVERSIAISTRVFWMNVGLERPSKTLGKHVLSENTNTISIDEVNREIVVS